MKKLLGVALVAFLFVNLAEAGQVVDQGSSGVDWNVNTGARRKGVTTSVCVDVTATKMPATALVGRKAVEVQNKSAADMWCGFDPEAITSTGSFGRLVQTKQAISIDAASGIVITCVAAAAQTQPNCSNVMELR